MKKTLLLLTLVLTMVCSSLPIHAQKDVGLTMTFRNESLISVFQRLEGASSYKFLFNYDDVAKYQVTLDVNNTSALEVLRLALADTDLGFTVDGKLVNIVKYRSSEHKKAQENGRSMQAVGGYVVEKGTGEPIIGAQVKVVGSSVVTVTDVNGAFHFDYYLTGNQMVEVSYVGMKTRRQSISKEMRIELESDVKELSGVVVTGIFRKAKESYTGAVSTVDSKQLEMYRGTNLLQTLKNVDASLNFPVNNLAGSNPNVLPNLNIRGSSTLPMNVEEFNNNAAQTVNTPLVILDGFEISLAKLMDYNDDQIESINILKDAAATAIYGSRGANGVIVVVTKQPKEGRLRVTAKAGLSFELPDLASYDLLNAAQKLQLEKTVGLYDGDGQTLQYLYNRYYNERLQKVLNGVDIDWLHKPVRTGVGQTYNVRLDGGASAFRWAASLGYNGIEGAMKGSSRRTLNGDITLMYSVKNLIFRNYTSITSNNARESQYGSFSDYVNMQPYDSPYDEDGNIIKRFDDIHHSPAGVGNPLYDATLNTVNKSEYFTFINNFSVEWSITDALRLRAKVGVSDTRRTSDRFLPAEHSTFNADVYQTASGMLRKGSYTYGTGKDKQLSGNLTMSYSKTFNEKHQVYVGADYSISEQKLENYSFSAEGFSNSNLNFIGNAAQYQLDSSPSGGKNTVRLVGLTGNGTYTYDNRYYIDLSYRVDGSSKFGSDKRFAPFWSAGMGWNIHNEHFMKNQELFSNLRLKASYGVTGTQDFTTESVYTTYSYDSDSRYLSWAAAKMMGLGNAALTWQKTKEMNVGMEAGLLKNRITAEVNYYVKNTSNLLSAMDLPLSSGFPSYTANVGKMRNIGLEASVNAYIIRDYEREFNWMVGGQLVYNKNEITKLSEAIKRQTEVYLAQNVEVSNLFYEGRPLNAIYAVRSAGIDPSTGNEIFYDRDGNMTTTWNASDKVYLGSSTPLWRGNLRSMVMYKNFTFNVSFGYHWGGKTYNQTLRNRVEVTTSEVGQHNVDSRVLSDRWLKPGDVTFFSNFSPYSRKATSRYVFDDRQFELQSVSLQYRWNNAWLKNKTGLESLVFGVNASDLFYWSSVKRERGLDYPYARNIQCSVTMTF